MKRPSLLPRLDPLGVKTGLELVAAGVLWLLFVRWLGL